MQFQQLCLPNVVDAVEEHDDRDAGEILAVSWAALDYLHTLFGDRAAGSLDFFTHEGRSLPTRQSSDDLDAKAKLPMCFHCTWRALGV